MDSKAIQNWRNNLLKHPEYDPVRVVRGDMFQLLDAAESFAKGCVTCTYGHEQFNMLSETALSWHNEGQAFQEQLRVLADDVEMWEKAANYWKAHYAQLTADSAKTLEAELRLREKMDEEIEDLREQVSSLSNLDDGRKFAG
jgi:hypothetical protein